MSAATGPKIPITNSIEDPLTSQAVLDTVVDKVTPGTAKNADEDWFVTAVLFNDEIQPGTKAAMCRCDFNFSGNDARISFTSDGVKYGFLHEGTVLKKDSIYTIRFGAENENSFNIKADEDVVVERCVVCVEGQQEPLPES